MVTIQQGLKTPESSNSFITRASFLLRFSAFSGFVS